MKRYKLEKSEYGSHWMLYERNWTAKDKSVLIATWFWAFFVCISIFGIIIFIIDEDFRPVNPFAWKFVRAFDDKQDAYNFVVDAAQREEDEVPEYFG